MWKSKYLVFCWLYVWVSSHCFPKITTQYCFNAWDAPGCCSGSHFVEGHLVLSSEAMWGEVRLDAVGRVVVYIQKTCPIHLSWSLFQNSKSSTYSHNCEIRCLGNGNLTNLTRVDRLSIADIMTGQRCLFSWQAIWILSSLADIKYIDQ